VSLLVWGQICGGKVKQSSNLELEQQDVHHMFGLHMTGPGNEGDNLHESHPAI